MARTGRRIYPMLVKLYPTSFRREYGTDLVGVFDELIASIGYSAAVRRVGVDLLVTVPRYQLEVVMNATLATRTLTWALGLLVVLGISAILAGGSPWIGLMLLLVALVLGLAQRTRLAEAIRVVDPPRRTTRFRAAGLSAGCFLAALGAWFAVVSDGTASTPGLLIPSVIGTASLVGMIGWLFAALLTPRQVPA